MLTESNQAKGGLKFAHFIASHLFNPSGQSEIRAINNELPDILARDLEHVLTQSNHNGPASKENLAYLYSISPSLGLGQLLIMMTNGQSSNYYRGAITVFRQLQKQAA